MNKNFVQIYILREIGGIVLLRTMVNDFLAHEKIKRSDILDIKMSCDEGATTIMIAYECDQCDTP